MYIKDAIRHTFAGVYAISLLHCVECRIMPRLVSDEEAIKRYYKRCAGKVLDLEYPRTFSEKMNWYKLNDHNPLMQVCADKFAVRDYVRERGLGSSLNELYGAYDRAADIHLEELPERFVLKAAHGSHMNTVWPDTSYTWRQARMLMSSWLKQDIYWSGREWVYKEMPRRIVAERYLEDETGELRDYKFFCYNGEPHFLQFDAGRTSSNHYRNYYDMNLNLLEVTDTSSKRNPTLVPLDMESFERMKAMARLLAAPFQFVRVDFYLVRGKVYFGEMTFFDGGGWSGFAKEEWDKMFGEPWLLVRDGSL